MASTSTRLYAPAIGSLMYAMVVTRPDIAHAVGVINRFMHKPGQSHWNVVKHVFRYLAGTKDHGILFGPNKTSGVVGYTNSEFASCVDSRKSTTKYSFKFGNGEISWKSKLLECTATSMTEAEYIVASNAAEEALWLSRLVYTFAKIRCSVEKSSSSQRLQAYRRSISLRSGLHHLRENRSRENIHNR